MTAVGDLLTFDPKGLFYNMVAACKMGLCGQLIFHPGTKGIPAGSIGLASTEHGALDFEPADLLNDVRKEGLSVQLVTDSLLHMLINSSYEACQDRYEDRWKDLRQTHRELEFFRHIRNAASHGGTYNFKKGEPSRQAEWHGRAISPQLQGKPLWDARLQPGDILLFLWDIEQLLKRYP